MQKKSIYRIILIIFIFVLWASMLGGCTAKKPPTPGPDAYTPAPVEPQINLPVPIAENIGDYLPLKVGNKWEYEGAGNEYASFAQEVVYEKGNKYQLVTDNGGAVRADIYEINENSIDNIYRSYEPNNKNLLDKEGDMDIVLLKLPIAVGTRWVSEENIYEIIQTDATVTVPYGTFDNCVVVRLTFMDGSTMHMYYKKGIGMVMSEFGTDHDSIISKLKSFTKK